MLRAIARKVGIGKIVLRARQCLYPEWKRQRALEKAKLQEDSEIEKRIEDSKPYFASLKNKYAGRRGFVIGNGPSLQFADLQKLKGEISIASNKIYLAFKQTDWRPDYITIADPLIWTKVSHEIGRYVPEVIISTMLPERPDCVAVIRTVRYLGSAPETRLNGASECFSDDLCRGIYSGFTVTFENLQLAAHLGLNPIYIIGCDHYYHDEHNVDANKTILAGSRSNHFIKNYRSPGEIVNPAPIALMDASYVIAKEFALLKNIRIWNATRGGFLEVFDRIDIDKVLL
jgi:hypothetical protein